MALAIGAFCYASVHLGRRLRNCRGFNLFGLHLVGGAMGVLLGGLAATRSGDGTHGGTRQFALFVLACAVAAGYSAVATHVLLRLLKASMRLRVLEDETRRCVAEEVLGMLPPQTGG
jgi:ammonia channel protein AmtB